MVVALLYYAQHSAEGTGSHIPIRRIESNHFVRRVLPFLCFAVCRVMWWYYQRTMCTVLFCTIRQVFTTHFITVVGIGGVSVPWSLWRVSGVFRDVSKGYGATVRHRTAQYGRSCTPMKSTARLQHISDATCRERRGLFLKMSFSILASRAVTHEGICSPEKMRHRLHSSVDIKSYCDRNFRGKLSLDLNII